MMSFDILEILVFIGSKTMMMRGKYVISIYSGLKMIWSSLIPLFHKLVAGLVFSVGTYYGVIYDNVFGHYSSLRQGRNNPP